MFRGVRVAVAPPPVRVSAVVAKNGPRWEREGRYPGAELCRGVCHKRRNPRFLGGFFVSRGAGEETRTLDLLHGKAGMAEVAIV